MLSKAWQKKDPLHGVQTLLKQLIVYGGRKGGVIYGENQLN